MEMKRSTKIIINIEYIAIILMVAVFVIGTCSFFVSCGAQWYTSINKSLLSPKIEVLGTISLLIFLTIAVSSYMILNTNYCENRSNTIQLFVINVTLISLWCYALFFLNSTWGAFLVIMLLFILAYALIQNVYKINKIAAWILVPYFGFIGVIAILNYSIVMLN